LTDSVIFLSKKDIKDISDSDTLLVDDISPEVDDKLPSLGFTIGFKSSTFISFDSSSPTKYFTYSYIYLSTSLFSESGISSPSFLRTIKIGL
jgi:hypothetical protein